MKPAVLLTRGAGFIGSHVADAYLEAGYEVTVVDDLSSGRRENVPDGVEGLRATVRWLVED
jgi:UDP-glucose 4-epimerase